MLQPLDVGIFAAMKHFISNCKCSAESSYQTKQIFKMHKSLFQACCPSNCKAAFNATGIITRIIKDQGKNIEVVYLDYTKCQKVSYYDIAYIDQLIKRNCLITDIQRRDFIKINFHFPWRIIDFN